MFERVSRPVAWRSFTLVVAIAGAAACNATGQTAMPTAGTIPTSAPSATLASSGPTAFSTTTFGVPFSLALPAGWKVQDDEADMFTAYISTDHTTLDVAIDIQLVPAVYTDPCNKAAGTTAAGSTAADLVNWLLAYDPLAATAGASTTIDGAVALVVDEVWAGAPCATGDLWPTPGGWLEAPEHKRFFVFEIAGRRLVAAIATSEAKFAANVDAALQVLASAHFLR